MQFLQQVYAYVCIPYRVTDFQKGLDYPLVEKIRFIHMCYQKCITTILSYALVSKQPVGFYFVNLNVFDIYTGIMDSSGMRFFYTDQPPQHNAGIITLGQPFLGHMIVPPNVAEYTITGHCIGRCTNTVSTQLVVQNLSMCISKIY